MKGNLLEALSQVPDFRAARGRRYPLWLLLFKLTTEQTVPIRFDITTVSRFAIAI
ncbi:MAG: hypothetical protein RIB93_13140 [Coleofasciculus sp. D1-CHI-01]|uniref:hypothetical protein n=1 Tax=Coleofasciculus sp. D1-CHI-01 TaxID=3068482 RepID=UPI0032FAFA84